MHDVKMLSLSRLVLSLFIGFSIVGASAAEAKLPPECVERFEKKVDAHIVAIDEAMNTRGRIADLGNKLLHVRSEVFRYVKGKWAKDCASAADANQARMNAYLKTKLQPAIAVLDKGFVGVCVKYGNERIAERLEAMKKAVKDGRPNVIDTQSGYLETALKRDTVLKVCTPIKAKIEKLKTGEFATLKKAAQVTEAKKKLAHCALPVERWEKIAKGLADGKKSELYEISVPDQRDIERDSKTCRAAIAQAETLGLNIGDLSVTIGQTEVPLTDVIVTVDKLTADPAALIATIRKHNKKWKAWFIGKWKRANIKGGGMRKVHKAHGTDVLPRVRNLGSSIVWTYRTSYTNRPMAECEEYTFSKKGSLKSRRAYSCP